MSSSSSPSSPQRYRGGNSNGGGGGEDQRPRFFDKMVKKMCWQNAEIVPGRHPERWRKDAAGNIVCKRFCNCHGCLCYEYDHILPFSKDKELDIIEMAVYGDVIRPGNQCRCRTIAEMLGQLKSKDRVAACKLPFSNESL
uniref:HNH domain-containing protein n=1 Tax=Populus trichocarpa TaxID=3694 RepID=A0A3N7GNM5_POPTR